MFDSGISVIQNQGESSSYQETIHILEERLSYMDSIQRHDITDQSQCVSLYELSKEYYRNHFPDIVTNYVPVLIDVWKTGIKDVIGLDNTHHDAGVQHFTKYGY